MNYENKRVWITGAASGIGKALALNYASKKAVVILSDRDVEGLNSVAQECNRLGGKAIEAPFDLADSEAIKAAAAKVLKTENKIDILIASGGISQRSLAIDTPVEIDRKILEINFFGAVTLTKELLPSLIADGGGKIAVISSITGKFGFPLRSAYCASKHALQGYYEALRAELYSSNIKITIISPGRVKTNISLNAIDKEGKKHGVLDPGQAGGITPEKCAEKIEKAVRKNRKELLVGGPSTIMVHIRHYLPGLFHRLARKINPT